MHFIIGVDIITKRIKYILIILLIFSCAGIHKKERTKENKRPKISIMTQHWNTGTDSLNLYMYMALPLNHLVFKKNIDHFFSEVTFTLVISDKEQNTQMYRKSWKEEIIEPYYEDTRDQDNYYKTEKNISLLSGTYNLFLNVQDEDSRKNWKATKEIELDRVNHLSPALLYIKNKDGQLEQVNTISEKTDTIWLRTQVNLQAERVIRTIGEGDDEFEIDSDIQYTITRKETIIDSGNVDESTWEEDYTGTGIKNLYYLPIPLNQHKRGRYEIELILLNDKQTTTFHYGYKTKNYWTDEIDEVVGVMRYILPYSEYKKLKEKDDSAKWKALNKYWKEKDPSLETKENELLDELNQRVKFANKNFSILMHGWRSDRGRIYIIYGEPHLVDESYQDSMGYNYQKWVYSNGKEFIFIDRSMSGDYTLYQERF